MSNILSWAFLSPLLYAKYQIIHVVVLNRNQRLTSMFLGYPYRTSWWGDWNYFSIDESKDVWQKRHFFHTDEINHVFTNRIHITVSLRVISSFARQTFSYITIHNYNNTCNYRVFTIHIFIQQSFKRTFCWFVADKNFGWLFASFWMKLWSDQTLVSTVRVLKWQLEEVQTFQVYRACHELLVLWELRWQHLFPQVASQRRLFCQVYEQLLQYAA